MRAQIKTLRTDNDYEIIIAEENEKEIVWLEDDEEFCLNGVLYDVAKIKKQNGKTLLYCINDKKEELLLSSVNKVIHSNNQNGKETKSTLKFQLPDYIVFTQTKLFQTFELAHQYGNMPAATIPDRIKEINAPPPRV